MKTAVADDDEDDDIEDGHESAVFTMDLRDITARVCAQLDGGEKPTIHQQPMIVLSDGRQRLELTGGPAGCSGGSIPGAQRIAFAALDYASGMALIELPWPEPPKVNLL